MCDAVPARADASCRAIPNKPWQAYRAHDLRVRQDNPLIVVAYGVTNAPSREELDRRVNDVAR